MTKRTSQTKHPWMGKGTGPIIEAFYRDGFRLLLMEDGRSWLVQLVRLSETEDEEIIAMFAHEMLASVIILLNEAMARCDKESGCRRLPTAHLQGKTYFIDERLQQLRNVDDPHDCFSFRMD